jgi:HlyD family secretion protein
MKIFKLGVIVLVLGSLVLLSLSCNSTNSGSTTTGTSISSVKQGTILTSVIGTGNLALKTKQELSFGETGLVSQQSTVKIAEVNVKTSDIVEQGQILVKADTSDWQTKITSAQHDLDSKNSSLLQAQVNLESAQYNLLAQIDIKAAQDKIDNTNIKIQQAQLMLQEASRYGDKEGITYWHQQVSNLDNYSVKYTKDLTDLLTDPIHSQAATSGTLSSVADIKAKQRAVEQAKAQVVNAQNNVDDSQTSLEDVKNSSQEIKAPFKGLITKINLSGSDISVGDIVSRSTNLIEIAEPDSFVADILVTEIDVMNLSLNENATVSFNALTGLNFPAKITKIAPLATVSQGVVNYSVTVELTSTKPLFNRPALTQTPSQAPTGGATQTGPPSGNSSSTSRPTGSAPAAGGRSIANISLKDGLSATVTIIIQQKDNVLIIPNRAITRASGASTVQIVTGTSTESRTITTGLSDSSNTEVTSGLNVGDQVMVKTSTANTSQFGPGGGAFRIP